MLIQVARSWIEFHKGEAHEGQEEQWRNCRCATQIVWHCSFRFPFDASAHNRFDSRPSKQHSSGNPSGWLHATVRAMDDQGSNSGRSTLSHIREPLMGNFGRPRYLAWIKSACRREHREPLVRKGRATFIPYFHRVGVDRLPAGQFDGSRSVGPRAGMRSDSDALDSCPFVCICEVRPSWITAWQRCERSVAGLRSNYQKNWE